VTRSGKVVTLRREESQVSKKTLIRLKAQKLKKSSATSSSSESINSDGGASVSSGNEMEICRRATHSTKQIEDIDANDAGNPLLMSEYVNDIYKYLYDMETRYAIKENHLEGHKEITHKMRTILVDWINEVHCQFKLEIETYHMAVSIIDRYLQSVKATPKKQLQLVGVTAMFIASKYEELFPPEIQDFVYITDDTYNKKQILEMEKQIVYVSIFNERHFYTEY
jgi:cyclin B